jgi:glycosyltransferase involved in cell wall biosynthesis
VNADAGMPLVSVLVLAYNHGQYLAEALDSILAQDVQAHVEVIIGEDCSPDDTREIAERYAREHPDVVRLVTSSHNVGMHENHRRLLRASRGEFVAYCEGDDFWSSPAKLRLQLEHLRAHPEHVGVHSDVDHLVERNGRRVVHQAYWAHHRPRKPATTTFDDLLVENVVQTCSVVLRGEVARTFTDSALGQSRYVVDDWPLFLHSTMSGPLGCLPAALATYRRVEGSATNQGVEAAERRLADQLRLLRDAAAMHPHQQASLSAGLDRTRWALVVTALRAGDVAMAWRWSASDNHEGREARLRLIRVLGKVPGVLSAAGAAIRLREQWAERRLYR